MTQRKWSLFKVAGIVSLIILMLAVTIGFTGSVSASHGFAWNKYGAHYHDYGSYSRDFTGYGSWGYRSPGNRVYVHVRTGENSRFGDSYNVGFGFEPHKHINYLNRYGSGGYHGHSGFYQPYVKPNFKITF